MCRCFGDKWQVYVCVCVCLCTRVYLSWSVIWLTLMNPITLPIRFREIRNCRDAWLRGDLHCGEHRPAVDRDQCGADTDAPPPASQWRRPSLQRQTLRLLPRTPIPCQVYWLLPLCLLSCVSAPLSSRTTLMASWWGICPVCRRLKITLYRGRPSVFYHTHWSPVGYIDSYLFVYYLVSLCLLSCVSAPLSSRTTLMASWWGICPVCRRLKITLYRGRPSVFYHTHWSPVGYIDSYLFVYYLVSLHLFPLGPPWWHPGEAFALYAGD